MPSTAEAVHVATSTADIHAASRSDLTMSTRTTNSSQPPAVIAAKRNASSLKPAARKADAVAATTPIASATTKLIGTAGKPPLHDQRCDPDAEQRREGQVERGYRHAGDVGQQEAALEGQQGKRRAGGRPPCEPQRTRLSLRRGWHSP